MCIEKSDLDALFERIDALEAGDIARAQAIDKLVKETGDLLEFFTAMRGAFKVLHWVGKLAKPVGMIAAATAAVMTAWSQVKGGGPPPKL